jgi:hypothetical protein
MKTPEELAEDHANMRCPEQGPEFIVWCMCKDDFLTGYQAAAPQWISVKERLPEMNEWVLVDGPIIVRLIEPPSSNWKGAYAWETDHESFYDFKDVTHWMPLPKPPEKP